MKTFGHLHAICWFMVSGMPLSRDTLLLTLTVGLPVDLGHSCCGLVEFCLFGSMVIPYPFRHIGISSSSSLSCTPPFDKFYYDFKKLKRLPGDHALFCTPRPLIPHPEVDTNRFEIYQIFNCLFALWAPGNVNPAWLLQYRIGYEVPVATPCYAFTFFFCKQFVVTFRLLLLGFRSFTIFTRTVLSLLCNIDKHFIFCK